MGRDLIKNKIYGIIFIVIGALTVPIEWDATFFLFTLMLGFAIGRAERRRALKSEQKNKTATYNLTKTQLDALVRERISEEMDRARQERRTMVNDICDFRNHHSGDSFNRLRVYDSVRDECCYVDGRFREIGR